MVDMYILKSALSTALRAVNRARLAISGKQTRFGAIWRLRGQRAKELAKVQGGSKGADSGERAIAGS